MLCMLILYFRYVGFVSVFVYLDESIASHMVAPAANNDPIFTLLVQPLVAAVCKSANI